MLGFFSGFFYWVVAALLLGVVIVLHELGHFWSARAVGIRVMAFGVGFGPKLCGWTGKDGVDYTIRLLPIGGYCKYYGEDDGKQDGSDSYFRQSPWKRAISVLFGPLMNLITAVVAFFVLFAIVGLPSVVPTVAEILPNTPAEAAGLLTGDRFVNVNGTRIDNVETITNAIIGSSGEQLIFTVERDGMNLIIPVTPVVIDLEQNKYQIGIYFGTAIKRLGVIDSAKYACVYVGETIKAMTGFLRDLVVRRQGTGDIVGPIGTVRMIREETQSGGIRSYINMLAMISVSLGFFNLLPIPGLDGSRLLFLLVEKIRGKRIDPNKEGLIHLIGIGVLLAAMLPIYIKDIVALFKG